MEKYLIGLIYSNYQDSLLDKILANVKTSKLTFKILQIIGERDLYNIMTKYIISGGK